VCETWPWLALVSSEANGGSAFFFVGGAWAVGVVGSHVKRMCVCGDMNVFRCGCVLCVCLLLYYLEHLKRLSTGAVNTPNAFIDSIPAADDDADVCVCVNVKFVKFE